jgi:PPM family protein phosphatase
MVESDAGLFHDNAGASGPAGHSSARAVLRLRSFGLTDAGKVRDHNEDQFLIASMVKSLQVQSTSLPQPALQQSPDRGFVFIVADGMGGHEAGERASALAVSSVEGFVLRAFQWFTQLTRDGEKQILRDFRDALEKANNHVLADAAEHPEVAGMGTTLTLAYAFGAELFVAHVGDSRCYLHRDAVLHRLTRDHTFVEEAVRSGMLSPQQAATHRWRHAITNAIGGQSKEVNVELHKLGLTAADRLLLCSDGLTNMVSDEEIAGVLATATDPEPACRNLVGLANEAGGKDNITVVCAFVDSAA